MDFISSSVSVVPLRMKRPPNQAASAAPRPLNACAKFKRRGAVAGSPKTLMYGFAAVSRKVRPLAMMKSALRKNEKERIVAAGQNRKAPVAKSSRPPKMPMR